MELTSLSSVRISVASCLGSRNFPEVAMVWISLASSSNSYRENREIRLQALLILWAPIQMLVAKQHVHTNLNFIQCPVNGSFQDLETISQR